MPRLDAIRECFDGTLPGVVATCSADGTPNAASLSHTEYLDRRHVALSRPQAGAGTADARGSATAGVIVTHPATAERYRLRLRYLRTETAGPLFERMKARLAGPAAAGGGAPLAGSDVYRVLDIERLDGPALAPPPRANRLAALRTAAARLAACRELDVLLNEVLASLAAQFDIGHAAILRLDGAGERLYTVASRGYLPSGVGSDLPVGRGAIGIAAREATPIRTGRRATDYAHGCASDRPPRAPGARAAIPLPGLPLSASRLAVPIRTGGRTLGVLYVESPQEQRFGCDDEDALVALAGLLGAAMASLRPQPRDEGVGGGDDGDDGDGDGDGDGDHDGDEEGALGPCRADGPPLVVRHDPADDTVLIGDDYLIGGVAGALLWTMLRDFAAHGRCTFAAEALRRDPRVRLSGLDEDVEARLIVLRRRLDECGAPIGLEKLGRGRLLLAVPGPLALVEAVAGQR